MKLFKALFVLALVVAFAAPAYAETQNVKVSGSIDMYHFYRRNLDLLDGNDSGAVPAGVGVADVSHGSSALHRSEGDDYFMTITQVEVSADLTDNVYTVINLINQRDWNAGYDDFSKSPSSGDEFDILGSVAADLPVGQAFIGPALRVVLDALDEGGRAVADPCYGDLDLRHPLIIRR